MSCHLLWGISGKHHPDHAHTSDSLHKLCKSSALGIWLSLPGYARIN